jgi:hypothetical protein
LVTACGLGHPEVENVGSAIGAVGDEVGWHIGDAGGGPRTDPGATPASSFSMMRAVTAAHLSAVEIVL